MCCGQLRGVHLAEIYIRVFRREGTRTRSWRCRTRCPVECGCASAQTPPPRFWFWTPLSPLTCWTASTLATPTWGASLACQVGPCQRRPHHLCSSGQFIFKVCGVCFCCFGFSPGILETDFPAGEEVHQDAEAGQSDGASLDSSVASVGSVGSDGAMATEGTTAVPQTASLGLSEHSSISASGIGMLTPDVVVSFRHSQGCFRWVEYLKKL